MEQEYWGQLSEKYREAETLFTMPGVPKYLQLSSSPSTLPYITDLIRVDRQ